MFFSEISLQGNKGSYERLPSYQGESSHGQEHPSPESLLQDLAKGSRIIRGVTFPGGFFFRYKFEGKDHFESLQGYSCDAVVDGSKKIVAVFLKPSEHTLYGIYHGPQGPRVKLIQISIIAEYLENMYEKEYELYPEFVEFKKPPGIFRATLQACG